MNHKKLQLFIFLGAAIWSLSFQAVSASGIDRGNVIGLTNSSRIKGGLNVLMENSKLNEAAMEKAKDMLQNNYFAHTSPQDITPWAWFEKVKYDYRYAGENLAINFRSAEGQHEAWMESEAHKKNILNSKYQEIGVAVQEGTIDNQPALVTVQLFGAREDFQAVLGQVSRSDQADLLSQEPVRVTAVLAGEKSSGYSVAGKLAGALGAGGALTLILIMVINPILVAGMFWRGQKLIAGAREIAYPVRIILVK